MTDIILIIAAAAIPGYIAFRQYSSQQDSEANNKIQNDSLNKQIERLKEDNSELKTGNISLQNGNKALINLTRKLLERNEILDRKLQKNNDDLIKRVIGDGIPTLSFAASRSINKNEFNVLVENNGNYPIYDIGVEIFNSAAILNNCKVEKIKDKFFIERSCAKDHIKGSNSLYSLGPGMKLDMLTSIILEPGFNFLTVKIISRAKFVTYQYIVFYKAEDRTFNIQYRLFEFKSGKNIEIGRDTENRDEEWDKHFLPLSFTFT